MTSGGPAAPLRLPRARWLPLAAAHAERADALTAGHRERARRRERHPVEDFLFTYYSITPSILRRWHPGPGVILEDSPEYAGRKWYVEVADGAHTVDATAHLHDREAAVGYIDRLLRATASRRPVLGCFGMHEWAMVHGLPDGARRHAGLPLRLGPEATDRVVENLGVACTHFDAFRFFTPTAVHLNAHRPTRATQPDFEQPGCLHAGMDLYKWCGKLGPLVAGDLLLDAFELARDARVLDMEASPYDVRGLGYGVVAVETPAGRAEYVRRQQLLGTRAAALRERILEAIATGRRVQIPVGR